jgi:hypothetical protein
VDWSFFDLKPESHGLHGAQRMANTLSTEAPTDFGVNLESSVENRGNLEKSSVCVKADYAKPPFDHFLIRHLHTSIYKACSR